MRCGICTRVVRKTSIVHAPDIRGALVRKRACASCASCAIVVVPIGGATRCACGCGAPATYALGCAADRMTSDRRKLLAPFVARLRKLAVAYPGERGEGLTTAADLLERGEA